MVCLEGLVGLVEMVATKHKTAPVKKGAYKGKGKGMEKGKGKGMEKGMMLGVPKLPNKNTRVQPAPTHHTGGQCVRPHME